MVLTKSHDQPPEPPVLVGGELGGVLHDERPLSEREAEAGQGAVAARDRVAKTHQQQETDPVEQERHWGKNKLMNSNMNFELLKHLVVPANLLEIYISDILVVLLL